MSLINEALKKAQRERAGHAGETDGVREAGAPARRPAATPSSLRPPPSPAGPSAGLLLGGLAVVLAAAALVVVVWRSGPIGPAAPREPLAAQPHPATPAPVAQHFPPALPAPLPAPAPAPVPDAVEAPATPLFAELTPLASGLEHIGGAPESAPIPAPMAERPASPAPPSPALVLPEWEPPPLVAVVPAPDRSAAIAAWLEDLAIQSVRFAGQDSRVLIRNRVYALGATVDRSLGLRLAEIHPNRIVFTDDDGTEFTKPF